MSRAVSWVRSFVSNEGNRIKSRREDIHTYQELVLPRSLRQLFGRNLRFSFGTQSCEHAVLNEDTNCELLEELF